MCLFLKNQPLVLEEVRKEYKNSESNCKSRKKAKKSKVAVRNFTASFRIGEVFGLLGPNGAGKVGLIKSLFEYDHYKDTILIY